MFWGMMRNGQKIATKWNLIEMLENLAVVNRQIFEERVFLYTINVLMPLSFDSMIQLFIYFYKFLELNA